jgi:hypothetical protein
MTEENGFVVCFFSGGAQFCLTTKAVERGSAQPKGAFELRGYSTHIFPREQDALSMRMIMEEFYSNLVVLPA